MDIKHYERKVRSQAGEDGIIAHLIERAHARPPAVEIGCHHECGNCYYLAEQGWKTLFVDCEAEHVCKLMQRYPFSHVSYKHCSVSVNNVNDVVPSDTGVLSIDIDGNDYWIWQALSWLPTIVVIEFNWVFAPPEIKIMPYSPDHVWNHDDYFGASLSALAALGEKKGYVLAGTDSHQSNAYFVRKGCGIEGVRPEAAWGEPGWRHPKSLRWGK